MKKNPKFKVKFRAKIVSAREEKIKMTTFLVQIHTGKNRFCVKCVPYLTWIPGAISPSLTRIQFEYLSENVSKIDFKTSIISSARASSSTNMIHDLFFI